MIYYPAPAQMNLEPQKPNRPDSPQDRTRSSGCKAFTSLSSSPCCPRHALASLSLPGKIPGKQG